MRIVFFSDGYWPRVNGLSVALQGFSEELRLMGHEVLLIVPDYEGRPDMYYENSDILRIPSARTFISGEDRLARLSFKKKIFEIIDQFKPDYVHIHSEFNMGTLGRKYCLTRNMPVIRSCHTYWEKYIGFYFPWLPVRFMQMIVRISLKFIYKKDEHLIVPTQEFAKALRSAKLGKEFAIIPAGIDETKFSPKADLDKSATDSLVKVLGFDPSEKKTLLFAGRLGEEKNIHFLLKAFALIQARYADVHLILAGDGPLRHHLAREIENSHKLLNIHLPGYIAYEQMPSLYRMCQILVFPSKTETLGLATLEAMSCGLPVAAIHAMGSQEILAENNGGILTREDPVEFAEAVLLLLSDYNLYREKSAQAVTRAAVWSRPHTAKLLLDFYDKLNVTDRKKIPAPMRSKTLFSGLSAQSTDSEINAG